MAESGRSEAAAPVEEIMSDWILVKSVSDTRYLALPTPDHLSQTDYILVESYAPRFDENSMWSITYQLELSNCANATVGDVPLYIGKEAFMEDISST